jgi:hypothetical protein
VLIRKVGDWSKVLDAFGRAPKALEDAVRRATIREGQFLRGKIVEGIREQAPGGKRFEPLAETTLAVRKFQGFSGTKALLKRGDLRNSISVNREKDGVFIGVHRTARGKDGKSMIDVAAVHEYGSKPIVIRITPKMRAFLMVAFRKAGLPYKPGNGTGIIVSKVKARPFLRPVFEAHADGGQSARRVEENMIKFLKGVLAE